MKLPEQNTDSLRDIHLPDAISWWPPAVGWWVLLALTIVAFIFISKLYRRITYTPLNKVVDNTFKNIIAEYKKNNNESDFIIKTSQFLRQTAMSYSGRNNVAQVTGEQWIQTLNNLTEENYFNEKIKKTLINAPYQKDINIDAEQLINTIQNWLDKLPKKSKRLNK